MNNKITYTVLPVLIIYGIIRIWMFFESGNWLVGTIILSVIILIALFFIFHYGYLTLKYKKVAEDENSIITDLKNNGKILVVNLSDCQIETSKSFIKTNDSESIEVIENIVSYIDKDSSTTFKSLPLYNNRETILMKMLQKKNTYIYTRSHNYDEYYFDLEFLN